MQFTHHRGLFDRLFTTLNESAKCDDVTIEYFVRFSSILAKSLEHTRHHNLKITSNSLYKTQMLKYALDKMIDNKHSTQHQFSEELSNSPPILDQPPPTMASKAKSYEAIQFSNGGENAYFSESPQRDVFVRKDQQLPTEQGDKAVGYSTMSEQPYVDTSIANVGFHINILFFFI